jgi:hypothetical protein
MTGMEQCVERFTLSYHPDDITFLKLPVRPEA